MTIKIEHCKNLRIIETNTANLEDAKTLTIEEKQRIASGEIVIFKTNTPFEWFQLSLIK